MSTIELISELGCRYSKLQELLVAKKWREADIETYKVMLSLTYPEIANGQNPAYNIGITFKDVIFNRVACEDIYIIDRLWVIHSEERFGFSTQKHIWDINKKNWNNFGSCVGWRASGRWLTSYSDFTFELWAREGQLPVRCHMWYINFLGLFFPGACVIHTLASRLIECSNNQNSLIVTAFNDEKLGLV